MDFKTDSENALGSQPHEREESGSSKVTITLRIINNNGDIAIVSNISDDLKISHVMKKSFLMFFKHEEKSVFKYNVLLIRTAQVLARFNTVKENEVKDNDELLLVERFVMEEAFKERVKKSLKDISSKHTPDVGQVPDQSMIHEKTKKMKTKNKKTSSNKPPQCSEALIQIELNKVFLSLIEVAANLSRFNDVKSIYKDIMKKLELDLKLDKVRLRQILDMGYSLDLSRAALSLKRNRVGEAIDWLAAESTSVTAEDLADLVQLSVDFEKIDVNADNFADTIQMVTRYLRKRLEFAEVSEENVKKIKNLGFTENEIRRALRKSSNEPNRACLFLLGEPYDDGANHHGSVSSGVVDTLLRNPDVLVALSDRNILIALLDVFHSNSYLMQERKLDDLPNSIIQAFKSEKQYKHGCRYTRTIMTKLFTIMYLPRV